MRSSLIISVFLVAGLGIYGQTQNKEFEPGEFQKESFLLKDTVNGLLSPEMEVFFHEHGWRSGRIVGGSSSDISDYPWQVAILTSSNQQFCGGSILNDRWILTAAHCIGVYSNIRVRAGVTNKTNPGQTITVEQQIVHPDYQSINNYDHDIALLYLSSPLDLSGNNARAIPIMTQTLSSEGFDAPGVLSTITGWGALSWQGSGTNILQAAQVPITSNIGSYPPSLITPDMLLAGYPEGGVDACQGDSGGPLAVPDGNGYWYLAGITSWGNGCAFPNYPGVYARVSHFEDWIGQYVPLTHPDAPGTPENFTLEAGKNDALQVNIQWSNPTNTFSGEILTELSEVRLYRNNELIYSLEEPVPGAMESYMDSDVPQAGMYNYSLRGINNAGEGLQARLWVFAGEKGVLMKEFFTDSQGALPQGWLRTGDAGHHWFVSNTFEAGGQMPELQLFWNPAASGLSRVVSYPVAIAGQEELSLSLRQFLNNWPGANEGEIAAIDVTFDNAKTWNTIWENLINADISQGLYQFSFSVPSAANSVQLGIRFEGDSYNINHWYLDDFILTFETETATQLDINLVLEGPHAPEGEALMHTNLRDAGVIPLSQPFGPQLPYFGNDQPVWYYTGSEVAESLPEDVVDWVLLELRDAPDVSQADVGTVVWRRAALLLNTGEVTDLSGESLMVNVQPENELFVVVYHRNHLAVMSAQPLLFNDGTYSWDFTTGIQQAYQQGQKHLGNGIYGLFGGDGDGNGQIQTQDKNEIWNQQAGQSGYLPGDFDLNGQVQTQDKNEIWNPNSGVAAQVP
ncbi:MAG: serine protease [Bacteroidetes bacterium]|nr:MAG: serine protease [Bacteroidota bacterium]